MTVTVKQKKFGDIIFRHKQQQLAWALAADIDMDANEEKVHVSMSPEQEAKHALLCQKHKLVNDMHRCVVILDCKVTGNAKKKTCHCPCRDCGCEFWTGSVMRMRSHILKVACSGVKGCTNPSGQAKTKALEQARVLKRKKDAKKEQKKIEDAMAAERDRLKRQKLQQVSLHQGAEEARKIAKIEVDTAWGKFFFANGTSFNVAADKHFLDAVRATSIVFMREGTKPCEPPDRRKLATETLEVVHESQDGIARAELDTFGHKLGHQFSFDGFSSNPQRVPLVNFALSCGKMSRICKVLDTTGNSKTAEHVSEEAMAHIETHHDDKRKDMDFVCSDGAERKTSRLTCAKFKWMSHGTCLPHGLNDLLKDHGEIKQTHFVLKTSAKMVAFINKHHKSLALHRKESDKALLVCGHTRFASRCILCERLCDVRASLQRMVVAEEWKQWLSARSSAKFKKKGKKIARVILSEAFWDTAKAMLDATCQARLLLRFADSEMPIIGKVHWKMAVMQKELRVRKFRPSTNETRETMQNKLADGWEHLHNSHMSAAYGLDPHFIDCKLDEDEEIMSDLRDVAQKMLFCDESCQKHAKFLEEHSDFRSKSGPFSNAFMFTHARSIDCTKWWRTHGISTPSLMRVALKVLSKTCNVSSNERNWKDYTFIWNRKRNRLSVDRAEKLMRVHADLRFGMKTKDADTFQKKLIEFHEGDNDLLAMSDVDDQENHSSDEGEADVEDFREDERDSDDESIDREYTDSDEINLEEAVDT